MQAALQGTKWDFLWPLDNSFWAQDTTVFLKALHGNYKKSFYRGMTDPLTAKSVKTSAYRGRCTEFLSQSTTSIVVQLWTAINTWLQVRLLRDSSLVAFETACKFKVNQNNNSIVWIFTGYAFSTDKNNKLTSVVKCTVKCDWAINNRLISPTKQTSWHGQGFDLGTPGLWIL